MSSSHFATAERQYRFPLATVASARPPPSGPSPGRAACFWGQREGNVVLNAATMGTVVDFGIKDAANMGAAMAPAAYHTITRPLRRPPPEPQ